MASADNRIVKLEFDNSSFEKNVATSLTTIGKLNEAIAKVGTDGGGLKNISEAAKGFSLDTMSSAIDGISAKFVALSTIGITALANLTNKAVDAGLRIAKSLSLDQVTAGFNEYELKLGSIQTIMAGSGASLDVVNQKLQELNEYSDKTIYSFADMTTNIGKFTNAGVDLDTAVASIQGIANVAAVSGANSEEASRAMYNFAQALSKGHVQLMDWKSIELANMGTVEFKQQLIDAAVATGKLTKKGDEYVTSAGTMVSATKGFNESLTDQWLTTEVLTSTLSDYADETTDIGKKATAAAQDVKTFTQLMSTVKESIGSGWAQSFEILIGNFDEAKELFTGINNVIGEWVGKNADARNELLQGWKDMGGRDLLIKALGDAFRNLGEIMAPIKEAFRDIFPAMTAERLMSMTEAFAKFTEALKPSEGTVENIKRAFTGLFSILEIGWTVIKELAGLIVDFVGELTGLGSGAALEGVGKLGDFFKELNDKLVEGGGIADFFEHLKEVLADVIPFLIEVKDTVVDFIKGLDFSSIGAFFDSIGSALGGVSFDTSVFDPIISRWEKFSEWAGKAGDALGKFGDIVSDVWDKITGFFSDLAGSIGDAMSGGEWDAVTEGLGVGLLAAIAAMFAKFLKGGINIDFGGGFIKGITDSLDQLTGTLKAMETNLKAEALQKIAIAIGILTVSVIALSMIDSDDLAKAMAAMAVGFGQLMAALALLNRLEFGPKDTLKMIALGAALAVLAGAILILTLAAKVMSTMDWDELGRGLTGTAALIIMMAGTAKLLSGSTGDMLKAGVGILAMAVALGILALSMKVFATMNWSEMATGFAGIGVGLAALAGAMQLMPRDMAQRSAGLVGVGVALLLLAASMKVFATMDWGQMAKGFAGVGGGLVVMAGAMQLMPKNMAMQAASILVLSGAMLIMAKAMSALGELSWGQIAKGLVTVAGTLVILGIAMQAMSGSLVGAASILIVSFALDKLSMVIKAFAGIPLGDLLKGMLGIAIALGVLAGAAYLLTPAIPSMLLLGAALLVIGAGFALFGLGAAAAATAFAKMAEVGKEGSEALVESLKAIGKAMPALATGVALGIVELIAVLGEHAPQIVDAIIKILAKLIEGLTKLLPKVAEFVDTLITELLRLLVEKVPEIATAGLELLVGLLEGIRDNIGEIVIVVSEIITEFLDALSEAIPNITDSVANLIITLYTDVAEKVGQVAGSLMFGVGISFMTGFLDGLGSSLSKVWQWFLDFVKSVIDWVKSGFGIASPSKVMDALGVDLITGFLNGIISAAADVIKWFTDLAGNVLEWIGNLVRTLWDKGSDLINGLLNGVTNAANAVINWFSSLAGNVISWIGGVASTLWSKGSDFIAGLLNGITSKAGEVSSWLGGLGWKAVTWVGDVASSLWAKGMSLLGGLWDGIKDKWDSVSSWLGGLDDKVKGAIGDVSRILYNIGKDIFGGLLDGMKAAWESAAGWIGGIAGKIKDLKGPPEKDKVLLVENGMLIFQGLQKGMEDEWDEVAKWLGNVDPAEAMDPNIGTRMAQVLNGALSEVDINPTITPVLDLTQVQQDAKKLEKILPANSTLQAGIIAGYNSGQAEVRDTTTSTPEINFNQTINAPKQLSTVDIYRQTRNQIAMAKEELNIP